MKRDHWINIVGFFTVIGAIAALLVVPEVRSWLGLRVQDSTSEKNESRTVVVDARKMWVDTGIEVAGRRVRILYKSGQWRNHPTSPWNVGDGLGPYENQHSLIVPNGALAALVGKTNGGTFPVGTFYEGGSDSGRLYLSMNDLSGYFDDNAGSITVTVTLFQ